MDKYEKACREHRGVLGFNSDLFWTAISCSHRKHLCLVFVFFTELNVKRWSHKRRPNVFVHTSFLSFCPASKFYQLKTHLLFRVIEVGLYVILAYYWC